MMFQEEMSVSIHSHRLRLISLPDTLVVIFIVNQRHDVCTNTTSVPSGATADCFPPLKNRPCLMRVLRWQNDEEKSDTGSWILVFHPRLALRQLHASHELLESHLCGRQRRQLDDQGVLVLVKPVEGLCHGLIFRHELQRLRCAVGRHT